MRHTGPVAAAGLLLGLGVHPAQADPVGIDVACRVTTDALEGGGTVTSGEGAVGVAGTRLRVGARVIDPTGTYGLVSADGLRTKDRKAALGYLGSPRATSWFAAGRFPTTAGWVTSYEQARQEAIGLPADCTAVAGPYVSGSGPTVQYERLTVTLDDAGRIALWDAGGDALTFTYGPQTIDLPPAPRVAYSRWQRASQAASLDATMRAIARQAATSVVADPAAIEAALEAAVDPGRVVPLRLRELRQGTLIYARNPYTRTYHAWRVYVRDGEVRARRVAP